MAKVSSSFKCVICKEPLNFPNNTGIVDFMILILQFYRDHDRCEKLEAEFNKTKEVAKLAEEMGVEVDNANRPAES